MALTRAQVMTRSNDTIYEADFENNKVRKIGYFSDAYDLYTDDPLEEKLAEIERLSKVPIRNRDDIYHALKDRETLDNVLEQGLHEEHQKYKDEIVKFYMSIRSSIQKDSFNGQNSDATYNANNPKRRQQDTICSICREFANIRCINCNNVWLCTDHWKLHKEDKHNSGVLLD